MKIAKSLLLGVLATAAMGLSSMERMPSSAAGTTVGGTTSTTATVIAQHPGKILAGNCFQCHGTNGKNGPWDSLAGKSASEIYAELKDLQTKTTGDEAIMGVHARSYTDEQLRQIADFFSKVR